MNKKLVIGYNTNNVSNIKTLLDQTEEESIDFLCIPMFHPRYQRFISPEIFQMKRNIPQTRSDVLLTCGDWNNLVVGKVSEWIDLDSPHKNIRDSSFKAIKQEIAWASHLGLGSIMLPTPSFDCTTYALCVNSALQGLRMQILVHIPMVSTKVMVAEEDEVEAIENELSVDKRPKNDPWEWWHTFRTLCNHHSNLCVILEMTEDLPDEEAVKRWLGEPVRLVMIPTNIFTTDRNGMPELPQRHREFMLELYDHSLVQYVITGEPKHPQGLKAYVHYLTYLRSTRTPYTEQEKYEFPYRDYLQVPLQPLMDNLESQTYEVFEQDPVKYAKYELAVFQALLDIPEEQKDILIMVVGAGRGPLVRASLSASKRAERPCKIFAVEKNPNAVITLQNMKLSKDWKDVEIISSDMRDFNPTEKADILVSELLGSFGDNELSPECLDGAQRYLKEKTGVSIPQRYTSFLVPLSTTKLWNDINGPTSNANDFETGYVVKFHDRYEFGESQTCFIFDHPNRDQFIDNSRYITLEWTSKTNGLLHGFGGYFDSDLYKDVKISINPQTYSKGMFSWFPLFFPIKTPIYVGKGDVIRVHFWRCINAKKVWYEWCVSSPAPSMIHNSNGKSYWIGL